MKYKEFDVKYADDGNGSIEGYASTWIRVPDSYGDIVRESAFARTLKERWTGGEGIPLLWAHQMDNLKSYIGIANAVEDEKGLHFFAQFDGTEEAQRVRELYKDGRLRKFSFAYDVLDAEQVTLDNGAKANELRDLELYEISCVCRPANEDASVVTVKTASDIETKSGRRNSAKDSDIIKQIISLANQLLTDEVDDTDEEPKDSEVKAEEPDTANAEELKRKAELLKEAETILSKGE